MMKRTFLLIPIVIAAAVVAGCQNNSSPSSGDKGDKDYPLKGKVTAVNAAAGEVTIDHDDIPGLMKAMTMTFSVDDAKFLDGINPGTQVEGKVKSVSGKYVITVLKQRAATNAAEQKKIQAAIAQLPVADRSLAEQQRLCPVSDEPLGSMGAPVKLTIKGETVFICCKSCKEEVEKNGDETLKKVASFKQESK